MSRPGNRIAGNMFKDPNHPLAGRIRTGVKTTAPMERRPRVSMQLPEMYIPTMEDYARQMFSETDPTGTRVYYCEHGSFNCVDEQGRPIQFIGGLFKTNERAVKQFLQYFHDQGDIKYLELGDDNATNERLQVSAEHERGTGSSSSDGQPNEPHGKEPLDRIFVTPEAAGGGAGREDEGNLEQPTDRTAVSSSSGNGNDSPEQERNEPSREPDQEGAVEETELTPLQRLQAKAQG